FDDTVSKTRTRLLADHPWFGYLSMKLDPQESKEIKTSRTDGSSLKINFEHFESLTQAERETVFAQQIFHCAMRHPYRIGSRDLKLWNEACDAVANIALAESGFQLPNDIHVDNRWKDKAAEEVYAVM